MCVPLRIKEHSNPGRLIFGANAISRIPEEIKPFGKTLIVTDQGVRKAKILEKLTGVFGSSRVNFEVFDSIPSDPPIDTIDLASRIFQETGCSSVIGLGGGSCIDAAKAVAIVVSTGNPISTYRDGRMVNGDLIPVIAVPTTAGTGSEVTGVTVISDADNNIKLAIKGKPLVPKIAVLDPELLEGIPSRIAAATGADALVHAIEAFFSNNSTIVTDGLALHAVGLITRHLNAFVKDTSNLEHAYGMMMGSTIAGLAFSNAGLGLVHSLAHPMGAFYHVHHGLACAIYLLPVLEFNKQDCMDKFVPLANAIEGASSCFDPEKAADYVTNFVADLFDGIGIPRTVSDMGLGNFQVHEKMVKDAFAASPTKVNPRRSTEEEIKKLFESIC